ncbi:amino acid adenylation domain-containing protein, partial [Cryobacterium sp. 1639]|uniref:non-ribosomal peptide synthetase n=1 Tax=Cryobacterium inferilacus TaxID=2866629 RepID=UPI001C7326E5
MTTIASIGRFASDHGSAPALTCGDRTLSYAELSGAVGSLARRLVSTGVRPGDFVVVVAHRSERMIVAELAALAAGAIFTPVERRQPAERLLRVVADVAARCVIDCDGDLVVPGTAVLLLDEAMLTDSTSAPAFTVPHGDASTAVYCIYTSGSSGTPKGVVIEDGGLQNLCTAFIAPLLEESKVAHIALLASFAFDASIKMIYGALTTGRHLVILTDDERDDVLGLADRLAVLGVDAFDCTPSYLRALRRAWEPAGIAPRLAALLVGGEALDAQTADWASSALGAVVSNVYGPTEATVDATVHHYVPGSGTVNIGAPIPGVDVRIVRGGRPVGTGLPGELWIGGVGVARGYVGDPGLTAERFVIDPFGVGSGRYYRTGDLARRVPDGSYAYLGRMDDQVKIRGFRVEPAEIEHAMTDLADITGAAAIVVDDERGSRLVGFFSSGAPIDEQAALDALARVLPEHMVPVALARVDMLPLTPNGKLDRAALRTRGLPAPTVQPVSAATSTEQTAVVEAVAHVLHLDEVSVDADIFALGGDSISAILIVAALARRGHRIRVREVMRLRTPGAIADALAPVGAPLAALAADGAIVPTPLLTDFLSRGYADPHHHHQSIEIPLAAAHLAHVAPALVELVRRHPVLGARLAVDGLVVPAPGHTSPVLLHDWDLAGLSQQAAQDERERLATALLGGCDLTTGPLLAAAVVSMPDGTSLFLAAHHLAVDAVSWRIIADDVTTVLTACSAGLTQPRAAASAPFREWAAALHAFGRSSEAEHDRSHWTGVLQAAAELPERLRPAAAAPSHAAVGHRIVLDKTATAALVAGHATTLLAGPQEILVAAVTAAAQSAWGLTRVPLLIESHGRPEDVAALDGIDVSATVGWFTAVYPVVVIADGGAAELIRASREALRSVPNEGLTAGLLFPAEHARAGLGVVNFLGDSGGGSLNPYGEASSARNTDRQAFSVDAAVVGGELVVDLRLRADLAADVAVVDALRFALEDYAATERYRSVQGVLPSDLGLRGVGITELDALLARAGGTVEAAHPLTPLQEGMLFEHLAGGTDHIVQLEYELATSFDRDRLERTMVELGRCTPVLRSRLVSDGVGVPLQIVLASSPLPFSAVDLRGRPTEEQQAVMRASTEEQHARPFDLAGEAPFRCDVFALDDLSTRVVFTHHHVILDGWGLAELCRRFAEIHHELGQQQPRLPAGDGGETPTFAEYATWASELDPSRSDAYWAEALGGYEATAALPLSGETAGVGTERVDRVGSASLAVRLGERFAGTGATLAHVVQAAFGLVLGRACGSEDVVFGSVVSGRDVPLPGIDRTVGLFINTVPVRVQASPEATVS